MSAKDQIHGWKDWRSSTEDASDPNPAGNIERHDLDLESTIGGEEAVTKSFSCITEVTDFLSCLFNCDTIFSGTCGGFSSGCCPEAQ